MTDPRRARGPIAWMVHNPVAANLLMIMALGAGIVGVTGIKQEVFPEAELDYVNVTVPYPGASPAEVEQGILLSIEEAVRGVPGVKRVVSTSGESVGNVSIELLIGADRDNVLADVKGAVDRIQTFPVDAEQPTVALAQIRQRVVSLMIYGDQPLATLHALAERTRNELLATDQVTQVDVEGFPAVEISIEPSRRALERYGLTLEQIAQAIRASSVEIPSGELETAAGDLRVRVSDRRLTGQEFRDIVIRGTPGGGQVRLGEIARITDGYEDSDLAYYFDGERAIRVTAFRVGDETPIGVAEAVRAYAEGLRERLPESVGLTVWDDNSEILRQRIDLLVGNAKLGLFLVLVVLALFLKPRLAIWVAVGIPVAFLGAFALIPSFGVSVNMISLFALIITLGLVVDDAIVVGENVFSKLEQGMPRMQAAVEGAREMAIPVTFSILTTVAAFSPMFFVPGFSGKIFGVIPTVVISVLFLSLIESFFVLPSHLGHGREQKKTGFFARLDALQAKVGRGLQRFIQGVFAPVLDWVLRNRYVVVALAVAVMIVSVSLVSSGFVPFRFFPRMEGDLVTATAELPVGTPVAQTQRIQRALEQAGREAIEASGGPDVMKGMFSSLGQGAGQRGSHVVSVELDLVNAGDREVSAGELAQRWRALTPEFAGVKTLTFRSTLGGGAGEPIDVQLSHPDVDALGEASDLLTAELARFEETADVVNGFSAGKPQLDFHLLPRAATLGITAIDVARQLRSSFFGVEAVREQRGRNEMRVMVRLPESERGSEHDVERLLIRAPDGGYVPLAEVARFERNTAPVTIRREGGNRVVNVTSELAPGHPSPRPVIAALHAEVIPRLKERFPGLDAEMGGQQREQAETFGSLGKGYLLALGAIFALLAVPFRSYGQPLIVMAAIPFGFVGAVWGHLLMGHELSVISILGVVALSGVVVNDSLVLIDAANGARAQGMGAEEGIRWAAVRRFRPILLTSLTTFFGLVPMLAETSIQARFLIPMAISLGFGVLFATVIALLLVPALYLMLEDLKQWWGIGSRSDEASEEPADEEPALQGPTSAAARTA